MDDKDLAIKEIREVDDLIIQIAQHYGLHHQALKTVEECGELAAALSRALNADNKTDWNDCITGIISEMADVSIMILQMVYLMDTAYDYDVILRAKLNRQINRIKEGQAG